MTNSLIVQFPHQDCIIRIFSSGFITITDKDEPDSSATMWGMSNASEALKTAIRKHVINADKVLN